MTKNNLLIPIAVVGIVVLLIAGLYTISNDKNPTEQAENNPNQKAEI